MGFSLTLSHIIMVIASVCLASLFSVYAFYTGNLVQNELAQNVNNYKITVNIRLEIVYATMNSTATPPYFVIYAKNTGNLPFNDFASLDVYVGEYGRAQLYTYSETANLGNFNISTADGDNFWEPRETAVIKVYPTSGIEGVVFEAKLVPSKGIGSSYIFPAPPS